MRFALLLIALFVFTGASAAQTTPSPTPVPSPTPAPSPKPSPADISGKWNVAADAGGQIIDVAMEIKQNGDDFTGTTASGVGNGTIEGGKVTGKTFTATLKSDVQGQLVEFKMSGTVDGEKITGTFANAAFGSVPYSGARKK